VVVIFEEGLPNVGTDVIPRVHLVLRINQLFYYIVIYVRPKPKGLKAKL
jgi:hypothetical protein